MTEIAYLENHRELIAFKVIVDRAWHLQYNRHYSITPNSSHGLQDEKACENQHQINNDRVKKAGLAMTLNSSFIDGFSRKSILAPNLEKLNQN